MAKHSQLGPSQAHRWMNCAGSVRLSEGMSNPPTEHAVEGTVAHSLAEALVTGEMKSADLLKKVGQTIEEQGFEIEITDEMVDAAILYHDTIKADLAALAHSGKSSPVVSQAETRVYAKSVSPDLYGTADFLMYRKGDKLKVYDFKYGKGVVVDPAENPQMAIYAVAAMDSEAGLAFDEVELVIIQPRASHIDGAVRRWVVPKTWLFKFRQELKDAVLLSQKADAPLKAGDWCRWCPARASCPEMFSQAQKQAMVDFTGVASPAIPSAGLLTVEQAARALEWEETINSWFEAVKQRIRETLEAGISVPGWKLVDGKSNRKWIDEKKVVEEFSPLFGEVALFERKLLSPAKLEKIVGKGKLEELGLTMKPEAPKAIARDTDPRPVARSRAADDFTPVEVSKKQEAFWP